MEETTMWFGRYKLPSGEWQSWACWDDFQEAIEVLISMSQGRDFEIVCYETYQAMDDHCKKTQDSL